MSEPLIKRVTARMAQTSAEAISNAAQDLRTQADLHGIDRLQAIATELDIIAAELRATALYTWR
jgi:hypothetical protein